tara:strand:- start:8619 stop:9374 length:756 start_codon:yes stop_codon:yes gene_type:complete
MLKYTHDSQDDIPDGLESHYKKAGDKWVLDCEGAIPKAKLDEFRANNTELKKQLEKFKDIDPERHAELLLKADELDAAKATNQDKINELVTKRVETMQGEFDKQLAEANATIEAQTGTLTTLQIDGAVLAAGNEMGVRKSAAQDLAARARSTWKLVEGKPVAFTGEEEIFGKAGEKISMAEWMEGLATDAPHLFEDNGGSGSKGGGTGDSGDTTANPWMKGETFNLTKQGQMLKADPTKAKRMAAKAGVVI